MTNRAAATPYARALFDVTRGTDPARAGDELYAVVELVERHPDLRRVLLSPAVPVTAKRQVVTEILRLQPLSEPVSRLLLLLADRDRFVVLPEIAQVYQQRLLDFQQVVQAQVTTAAPLTPERQQAIEEGLATATGKRVMLSTQVDPAILGGVVARIGSRVYDGSVVRQLARVKEQLVADAV